MAEVGNIKISDEVVGVIAAKAATEVEGIYKMSGNVADEVNKLLGKRNSTKGIKVEVGEKECTVDAYVIVEYGVPIPQVAGDVQQSIIRAITVMTGLKVVEVNVYVQDIKLPSAPKLEDGSEIEEDEVEIVNEAL
jgi:uncharacterized alkaline shock family protein YloU